MIDATMIADAVKYYLLPWARIADLERKLGDAEILHAEAGKEFSRIFKVAIDEHLRMGADAYEGYGVADLVETIFRRRQADINAALAMADRAEAELSKARDDFDDARTLNNKHVDQCEAKDVEIARLMRQLSALQAELAAIKPRAVIVSPDPDMPPGEGQWFTRWDKVV